MRISINNTIFKYFIFVYLIIHVLQFFTIVPNRPILDILLNYFLSIFFVFNILRYGSVKRSDTLIIFFFVYNLTNYSFSFFYDNDLFYKKSLISGFPSVFFILSFFYFKKTDVAIKTIKFITKYYFPLILVLLIISYFESTFKLKGDFVFFFHPFLLFLLYKFGQKWKSSALVIIFLILGMILFPTGRAFQISLIFAVLLFFLHKYNIKHRLILNSIKFVLLITPLIYIVTLFYDVKYEGDSRSFLYEEVFYHLKENNSFLFGTTPGLGYQTELIDSGTYDEDGLKIIDFYDIWNDGRMSSESGIINFFHWGGILNVFLFTFIMLSYSNKIFKTSNNNLCKILSLYIIFRWFFSFFDGSSLYSIQYLSLWFFLAFSSSPNILRLSNNQLFKLLNKNLK